MTSKQCKLQGNALCKVKINGYTRFVITMVKVDATYYPDWQEDGGMLHDEGYYDYDLDKAEIIAPDEYLRVDLSGRLIEGNSKIDKLLEILQENLEEI